jgi:hypothetical protein
MSTSYISCSSRSISVVIGSIEYDLTRRELAIQVVDHFKPDRDNLPAGWREVGLGELPPSLGCSETEVLHPLMKEFGLNPLLPLSAVIGEILA